MTQNIEEKLKEFIEKQKHTVNNGGFLADVGDDYDAVDFDVDEIHNWLRQALTQTHNNALQEAEEALYKLETPTIDVDTIHGGIEYISRDEAIKAIKDKQL